MTETEVKDILDNRLKRVEILKKIDEIKLTRGKEELEMEKKRLEIKELEKRLEKKSGGLFDGGPVQDLLAICRASYIDNDKTIPGMEPSIKSLWDEEDLNKIRVKLLNKVKDL